MQPSSFFTFLFSFALLFQGIDALARSKLDQYQGLECSGDYKDGEKGRIEHAIDIKKGKCISIDARTDSIWLGRGTGLVWRRKMTAYSKPGCDETYRIDRIFEKEGLHDKNGKPVPKGNCIPVDYKYTGTPGVDQSNQGRLMSVKFDGM
ncbi:hypothetical protein MW887_007633 [Aspergillus wentii]|nr:hypothetical protein MW887_007633 [Aspergillus wentii]